MKKIYLKPEMELIEENLNQQLLAGSAPGLGDDFDSSSDPVLSPELDELEF